MRNSLRVTVIVVSAASVLLASAIILFISARANLNSVTSITEAAFVSSTEKVSERIDAFLSKVNLIGEALAHNTVFIDAETEEILREVAEMHETLVTDEPRINSVGYIDATGLGYFFNGATAPVSGVDIVDEVLAGSPKRYGNIIISPATNQTAIITYHPVLSFDGTQLIGALVIEIGLEEINSFAEDVLVGTAYPVIYQEDGTFLYHPTKELIGTSSVALSNQEGYTGLGEIHQAIMRGEDGFGIYEFDGEKKFMAYSSLTTIPWAVAITDVYTTISRTANAETLDMLWMNLIAMAVSIALVIPVLLYVTRSIRMFQTELNSVLGDSSIKGDLSRSIRVISRDEMGQATIQFNQFIENLAEIVNGVNSEVSTLDKRGADLATNMEETASAVVQINANLVSIQEKMDTYYSKVNDTNGAVQRIGGSIDDARERIEEQIRYIGDSSAAVEEMIANIRNIAGNFTNLSGIIDSLSSISEEGQQLITRMTQAIGIVSERSAGLMETNAIINTISAQTNLLAMNAAIEAAHAGDAGRGFAVVADEIRKLAEMSAGQSKEVSNSLREMHIAIEGIVDHSEDTATAFGAIHGYIRDVSDMETVIRNSLEEQSSGSVQVLEALGQMRQSTETVQQSSSSIDTIRAEVVEAMKALTDLASDLERGLAEITSGTGEINIAVTTVQDLVSVNSENITKVAEVLAQLKVK